MKAQTTCTVYRQNDLSLVSEFSFSLAPQIILVIAGLYIKNSFWWYKRYWRPFRTSIIIWESCNCSTVLILLKSLITRKGNCCQLCTLTLNFFMRLQLHGYSQQRVETQQYKKVNMSDSTGDCLGLMCLNNRLTWTVKMRRT